MSHSEISLSQTASCAVTLFFLLAGAARVMTRLNLSLLCSASFLCCDAMLNSPVACCTMLISCMQTCWVRKARPPDSLTLPS